jgi:hypothetical protein
MRLVILLAAYFFQQLDANRTWIRFPNVMINFHNVSENAYEWVLQPIILFMILLLKILNVSGGHPDHRYVVLRMCHRIRALCEVRASLHKWRKHTWGEQLYMHSRSSVLDGGELSASRPGRSNPRERNGGMHWIGSWIDLRAGLDLGPKKNILVPTRYRTPKRPSHTLVTVST